MELADRVEEFTPGPWEVLYLNEGGPVKSGGWEIVTPDYDVVAWIERGAPIRKEEDARLIAAAPAMYEALKAILDYADGRIEDLLDWNEDTTKLVNDAHAALAAADGAD